MSKIAEEVGKISGEKIMEVIAKVSELPIVKVDRETFLRKTFKDDPYIEDIIKDGPQSVYTVDSLQKKANSIIRGSTSKTALTSFLSGLPSNHFIATAAAGADLTQYFGFSVNLAQKISYLFGMEELDKLSSEEAQARIMFIIGSMFGVDVAKNMLVRLILEAGEPIGKRVAAQAVTKTTWYPLIKKIASTIGKKITKQTVGNAVAKGFSVVGGLVSGGITFVTFRPLGKNLTNVYVEVLGGKYDIDMVLREDYIEHLDSFEDVEFEEVMTDSMTESENDESRPCPPEEDEGLVWIGDNGNCYHKNRLCVNLNSPRLVTLDEAEMSNKRACKRCCK